MASWSRLSSDCTTRTPSLSAIRTFGGAAASAELVTGASEGACTDAVSSGLASAIFGVSAAFAAAASAGFGTSGLSRSARALSVVSPSEALWLSLSSSPATDTALLLLVDRPLASKPPCDVSFASLCSVAVASEVVSAFSASTISASSGVSLAAGSGAAICVGKTKTS